LRLARAPRGSLLAFLLGWLLKAAFFFKVCVLQNLVRLQLSLRRYNP
jgi:hypothetical protein